MDISEQTFSNTSGPITRSTKCSAPLTMHQQILQNIRTYYQHTNADYSAWSSARNMHFGLWRTGMSWWDREAMLETMNDFVSSQLDLTNERRHDVADFGCGFGATARRLLQTNSNTYMQAISLCPQQIAQGQSINELMGINVARCHFRLADYINTGLHDQRMDAVYAVESACHADGCDKRDLIKEMIRVLKPGGTLLILDAFVVAKNPPNVVMRYFEKIFCKSWALPSLPNRTLICKALTEAGCADISVQDLSLQIVPSAMHVPAVCARYIWRVLRAEGLSANAWKWRHAAASMLALVLGMCFWRYRYLAIKARKI
jgi:MPBQ/MSBQ methyltransferase